MKAQAAQTSAGVMQAPPGPPGPDELPLPSRRAPADSRRTPSGLRARLQRLRMPLDLWIALMVSTAVLGFDPLAVLAYAAAAVFAISALDGYGQALPVGTNTLRVILRLGAAGMIGGWAAVILTDVDVSSLLLLWALSIVGWTATRLALRKAASLAPERAIVLGSGQVAQRIVDLIARYGEERLQIVGFIDEQHSVDAMASMVPHLGTMADLRDLLAADGFDRVLVAFSAQPDTQTLQVLRDCDDFGVQVDVVPRLFEFLGTHAQTYALGGVPMLAVAPRTKRVAAQTTKRVWDASVAGIGLLVLSPLLAVVAVFVRLCDNGPVLYRQTRVGRDGETFEMLKFRSMRVDADRGDLSSIRSMREGKLGIEDVVEEIKANTDARVTRVGRVIRRASIDELPQLWNVVRGDMSLVGPRPLRPFEVETLLPWENGRHLERPGITGLWQVMGRSNVAWAERMHLDYVYVRHWSMKHDVEIMLKTARAVFKSDGAR